MIVTDKFRTTDNKYILVVIDEFTTKAMPVSKEEYMANKIGEPLMLESEVEYK